MGNEIHMLKKMVGASSKDATLKTVVKLILGSDWNDEVKLKLSDLKLSLSDNSVVSILSEFCKYPFKALEFFYWVQESQDFKHSAVTYNGIVWVLGKEESIEKFWILVKEMKSLGYDIDLETYRKVAKEFFVNQLVRSNKLIKDAVDLYELMMDSPYKPPIEYCSKLLRKISLLETPDLSLVDRVIKKSNEARDSFSKTEYDMVHRSFINAGKFDEAEKVLETMRNAGYAPDNFTLCQIVFGLFKAGKVEEACNKFDEMEAQGCVPDLRTRATLIQGLCSAGEVDKALACLMKTQKTYSGSVSEVVKLLVDHLCPNDKADIAYAFVVKMAEKTDFRPSRFTYETLIKKLLEEGKLEEAFNLLGMVINDSSQPILRPFISYISEKGTVDSAQESSHLSCVCNVQRFVMVRRLTLLNLTMKDNSSGSIYAYVPYPS
ncbi:hypothetical protein GIB67_030911 [Kingdonia uniflora]|uniref:Pentatricopeptide repeat-containing protein n=1 Tax=Kingdonia uniflora TaxID=39325 RepID=A0A7J7L3I8_9MAGN|nr:hypothetical protein GIB67_030911 [Kingdonia uniflora]